MEGTGRNGKGREWERERGRREGKIKVREGRDEAFKGS